MLKRIAAISAASMLTILLATTPVIADDSWVDESEGGADFGLKDSHESQGSPGGSPSGSAGGSSQPRQPAAGSGAPSSTDLIKDECADGPLSEAPICDLVFYTATADGPAPAPAAPPVDAAAEARKVRDQLDLPTPQIHTSPEDPIKTLVGLETWLWIDSGQWTPITESVNLDDTELTVTAKPVQTRWDMGEATTTCANPGKAWHRGLGKAAKTPCSYTYRHTSVSQPNSKYAIEASVRYQVTWKCSGDCDEDSGDLGEIDSPPSTAPLQVSERQTVVIR